MKRVRCAVLVPAVALLIQGPALAADVKTQERTQFKLEGALGRVMGMFGGKAAREGLVSTVAIKGDRKATFNEQTGEIVDLNEEKVYQLDMKKKTYEVTTFAEMRRRMEEAREEAEKAAKSMPREEAAVDPASKQVEVDFSVRDSGQKRTINGFDCREAIATVTMREKGKTLEQGGGMVMTMNLWMTPRVAALEAVSEFDQRYYKKLYGSEVFAADAQQMAMVAAMYPGLKEMMGKFEGESKAMDGTAILTVTTMETVRSPQQMAEKQEGEKESEAADITSIRGIGGLLGRKIGGKKAEESGPKNRATVFTSSTEYLKVTGSVSDTDVAIPPGFKQKK